MLVVISVNRMDSNGVQVCVARPQHNATSVQTYPSEAAVRAVLLSFGIAEKVLDDSLKLLPQLGANQPLKFPPLDVPQHELLEKGFELAQGTQLRISQ